MNWLTALPRRAPPCTVTRAVWISVLLTVASRSAHAENLLALAGITNSENGAPSSYGWQLELQEPLSTHLSGSLSWLNEGHVPQHHRDGAAAQLWLNAPKWRDRVVFSVGVGPYVYFDTEKDSSIRGYSDVHSAAAIVSASVAIDLSRSWYLSLNVNDIYAPGDLNTAAFLLGAGYHFNPASEQYSGAGPRQQIQVFAGQTIFNDLNSRQGRTVGLEYRRSLSPWVAWSASWFNNPVNIRARPNQVASQLWLVDCLAGGKLSLSAGLGVYSPLGSVPSGAANASASVSGLSGLRVEWNWSRHSSLILSWYRSFTNDDDDRDIITLGYGFRFGS
jgi:hypothetical protein